MKINSKIFGLAFYLGILLLAVSSCKKDDDPEPTYTLTVNGGSGSGTYTMNQVVNITANAPAAGQQFDQWTGDASAVADVNAATTTVTMPGRNITVTSTYTAVTYQLTVNSGSGSGEYAAGTEVNIQADAAPAGQVFKAWTGDVSGVADVNAAATTITMPGASASITATYENLYTLTVTNGTGGGEYVEGEEVAIEADAAAMGKQFVQWTGDVAGVADVNAASTTFTMHAANATIEATYTDLPGTYAITGTWKIENLYEALGGSNFSAINSSANNSFRITFNVDGNYNPTTYSVEPGAALAIPNFNADANTGDWTVDNLASPDKITFDPAGSSSVINVNISPEADKLVIWWDEVSEIEGKPTKTFKMELIPAS